MTPEELAAIRARADAASTGPWTYKADDFSGENWWIASIGADADDGRNYYVTTDNVYASEFESSARGDADFIANARADVPALLDEVDRLSVALDRIAGLYLHEGVIQADEITVRQMYDTALGALGR